MNSKYKLTIPFTTTEMTGITIEENDNLSFNIGSNHVKINYDENREINSFEVINDDINSLLEFYKEFKQSINLMSLYDSKYTQWNIKLKNMDENDLRKNIIELKPSEFIKDGNTYIIKTNLSMTIDLEVKAKVLIKLPLIIKDIQDIHDKFNANPKVKNKEIVLDLYKNSFFQDKPACFLTWVNILELIAPPLHQKEEGIKCIDELNEIMKDKYKNKLDENDYTSIYDRLGNLKRKSITYCVQQLPILHEVNINSLEYTQKMIKKSYNVRSKIAHEGRIIDDFDECYNFLNNFLQLLLKKIFNIENKN